jgi:ankyrin repeat protein
VFQQENYLLILTIPVLLAIIKWVNDKKTYASLRLVSRAFKNFVSPYWKQIVPLDQLERYLSYISTNECYSLKIRGTYNTNIVSLRNALTLLSMNQYIKKLEMNFWMIDIMKNLPPKVEFVRFKYTYGFKVEEFKRIFESVLPNSLKTISFSLVGGKKHIRDPNLFIIDYLDSNFVKKLPVDILLIEEDRINCTHFYPLYLALRLKDLDLVKFLLEKGANVNAYTPDENFPLKYTMFLPKPFKLLMKYSPDLNLPFHNIMIEKFFTLMKLVKYRDYIQDIIKLLINHGAKIDEPIPPYDSLLFRLCKSKYREAVKFLLEQGANPNKIFNQSVLEVASINNDLEMVKLLLDYNANPMLCIESPLTIAFKHNDNNTGLVNLLLPFIQKRDFNLYGLHYAARTGDFELTKQLLENNVNPNPNSKKKETYPLYQALIKGHIRVANILLEYKADLYLNELKQINSCTTKLQYLKFMNKFKETNPVDYVVFLKLKNFSSSKK